jgi:hypothetical protein
MTHCKQLMGVACLGALVKSSPQISWLDFISHDGPNMAMTSWLFVIFGESHLAVLHLTDFTVRSPCSERPFHNPF